MEIFKSKDIKFGDEFYSMKNNRVVVWKVYGIAFMNYRCDEYGNKCRLSNTDEPDIEYLIETQDEVGCVYCNNINKTYFRTKEELFSSLFK